MWTLYLFAFIALMALIGWLERALGDLQKNPQIKVAKETGISLVRTGGQIAKDTLKIRNHQ
jgi:hypothetical protein